MDKRQRNAIGTQHPGHEREVVKWMSYMFYGILYIVPERMIILLPFNVVGIYTVRLHNYRIVNRDSKSIYIYIIEKMIEHIIFHGDFKFRYRLMIVFSLRNALPFV